MPGNAPPEPQADSPDAAPLEPGGPEPRNDEVWSLYHRAYAAAAQGRDSEARALLGTIVRDHKDHPAAQASAAVLQAFERQGGGAGPGAMPHAMDAAPDSTAMDRAETPSRAARAELALFQTMHGIALGVEMCTVMDCEDEQAWIALPLLGGAAGLSAAILATQDGITPGHRGALNTGALWGAFNAGMALLMIEPDDASNVGLALMGGQLAGLASGHLLWRYAKPTEGQVALTTTAGIWSAILASLAMSTLDIDVDNEDNIFLGVMLAADAGLVIGGYLASRIPEVSRGRTFLLDTGGVVGGLAGAGTAVLIAGDDLASDTYSAATLAGAVVGLAGAAYLSRHWDSRHSAPGRLTLLPNPHGGLSAGLMFDLDL